jgi:Flp pilus assembly protein TadG
MLRPARRATRTDRGAAAIELALVFPVLLLTIAGIVDFGRAFFTEITLANAAREGARAAIGTSATAGDVETRAAAAAPGLGGMTATPVPCGGPGTEARVTASVDFDWILLGPAMSAVGGGDTLPSELSSTAVMRCS